MKKTTNFSYKISNSLMFYAFFLLVLNAVESRLGAEAAPYRLSCGNINTCGSQCGSIAAVTLDESIAYVTSQEDSRINAILCEEKEDDSPHSVCFPLSCELSAGSICAIQSPNGRRFHAHPSKCVQAATALDFSKWMNRQRALVYRNETMNLGSKSLNLPTWVEHCVCSISTRNWFLTSRTATSGDATKDASDQQSRASDTPAPRKSALDLEELDSDQYY